SSARFPGSPGRRRSWPRGGRGDPLVDRQRDPHRGRDPGRRVPAARRPERGPLHRPLGRPDRPGGGRGLEGPRRHRAPPHHPGAGRPDDPARRELRRLARRDPRRRGRGAGMSGAAWVTLLAALVIVLALVYYLVSVVAALRQVTKGLDEVIASVGEI